MIDFLLSGYGRSFAFRNTEHTPVPTLDDPEEIRTLQFALEELRQLRGGMDASQYKDYVLTLLFVKYVSDQYAGSRSELIRVPEGASFADVVRLKNDKEIGDQFNVIIPRLGEANDLAGVIDLADFNDENKLGKGKEMVDRLSNLIGTF